MRIALTLAAILVASTAHAAEIRGTVIDADGKPVARAIVRLVHRTYPQNEPWHRTDAAGHYSFPAPDAADDDALHVEVIAPLQAPVPSQIFYEDGTDKVVDIRLPKFERVHVRILDADKKPVPHALVSFVPIFVGTGEAISAPTEQAVNAKGEITLRLGDATYDFEASAAGFVTKSWTASARPEMNLELERAFAIRGRAHRGETPIANLRIIVIDASGERFYADTNADGAFELGGIPRGDYRLDALKVDEHVELSRMVSVPGEVDIDLPPAGKVHVHVRDARTGKPVAQIMYAIQTAAGEHRYSNVMPVNDSAFDVTLPAGSYRIFVNASDHDTGTVEAQVKVNGTTNVELPLESGVTFRGRITGDDGAPLQGADVAIIAENESKAIFRRLGDVSNGDGVYEIRGVPPGPCEVIVNKKGFVELRKSVVAAGELTIDARLSRGLTLTGLVTRDGSPEPSATVHVWSAVAAGTHEQVTTEDGRFTVTGLTPGRYKVLAVGPGGNASTQVELNANREVVLAIETAGTGVVYGTVSGIPGDVWFERRVVTVAGDGGTAAGGIDEAGRYRIEDAPAGGIQVCALVESPQEEVWRKSCAQTWVGPGEETRMDLRLEGEVRVTGRVSANGRPVQARIGFGSDFGNDSFGIVTQSNRGGLYEVLLPREGSYNVVVTPPFDGPEGVDVTRALHQGDRLDFDLSEKVIEGTVVDNANGEPVADATIESTESASVHTDATGRFRLKVVASTPPPLYVKAAGFATRLYTIEPKASEQRIALVRATTLRIRIVDARTGALLDGEIHVSNSEGPVPFRQERGADGGSYVLTIAPGTFRVLVAAAGYAAKLVEATAPGAIEVEME